ncbi:MAG: hypothetical protein P1U40_05340 [Coxiellaceae bacterium]|nr:hypothetical protein [Coxiellaceae bacterium]
MYLEQEKALQYRKNLFARPRESDELIRQKSKVRTLTKLTLVFYAFSLVLGSIKFAGEEKPSDNMNFATYASFVFSAVLTAWSISSCWTLSKMPRSLITPSVAAPTLWLPLMADDDTRHDIESGAQKNTKTLTHT